MKQQPRLRQHYEKQVISRLQDSFGFENAMEVPHLEKIVINCGLGDAKDNAKLLDSVVAELARISGQKPVVTRARTSISNFNLREGMPVGVKVTLEASVELISATVPTTSTPGTIGYDRTTPGRPTIAMPSL